MSALSFRIIIDPLSFIHSLKLLISWVLSLCQALCHVLEATHEYGNPGPRARRAVDRTDHQTVGGVQGNEEDNEIVTFIVPVPVFTGAGV